MKTPSEILNPAAVCTFTRRDLALSFAARATKVWVIEFEGRFYGVRPVDAARMEKHGAKII